MKSLGKFNLYLEGKFQLLYGIHYVIDYFRVCRKKKEEIWLGPMTKAPTPTEKSKKQRDNTKTPPKTSITPRLRTDVGWSVGETTATQLVWLNRFMGSQPSHLTQKLCNQKDTCLKIGK